MDDNTDYSKLRVKELKNILAERGVECTGCIEKDDFVKKCKVKCCVMRLVGRAGLVVVGWAFVFLRRSHLTSLPVTNTIHHLLKETAHMEL